MKRCLDTCVIFLTLPLVVVISILIAVAIKLDSKGPVIYWSQRIGQNNVPFMMPKFRSMQINAPIVAAEKFTDAEHYISRVGKFLRKTSMDEIPQLWCVLKGQMSLVGPRPLLPIETDVLELRTKAGVDKLLPGISGWAQINGRTCITPQEKARLDIEYMHKRSLRFDLKIMFLTLYKVIKQDDIAH